MKRIAQYCFFYGCIASALALIWYVLALSGHGDLPQSVWVAETILMIHGITMVITFYRRPSRKLWDPILEITPGRIRVARLLLIGAAANCLLWFVVIAVEKRGVSERALLASLSSLVLASTVYIAVHWAFRPENLFPGWFLVFMSNPLGYPFLPPEQRRGRRDRSKRIGH